ncbi:MAG: hypothetical protein JWP97_3728 [Labilithrix sp.]|nr:hypothetical protein [Labilithrix sp.]
MKIHHLLAALLVTSCALGCSSSDGGAGGPEDRGPAGPATVRLALLAADGTAPATLSNDALVIRPDLASGGSVRVTEDGDQVQGLYNRLTCRATKEELERGFTQWAFANVNQRLPASRPLRIESISVVIVADQNPPDNQPSACLAYRTKDGLWHGELVSVPGVREGTSTRVAFEVHADDVDVLGVMFGNVYTSVSEISYVASRAATP